LRRDPARALEGLRRHTVPLDALRGERPGAERAVGGAAAPEASLVTIAPPGAAARVRRRIRAPTSDSTIEHVEGLRLAAQPVAVPALIVRFEALEHGRAPPLLDADRLGGAADLAVERGDVERQKPAVLHDQTAAHDDGGHVGAHRAVKERLDDVEV